MLFNKDKEILKYVKQIYDKFGFDYTEGYFNGSVEMTKLLGVHKIDTESVVKERLEFLQKCLDTLFAIDNGERETLTNIDLN